MFEKDFGTYVVVGEEIACEVDGITYTATIHHDSDSSPQDDDGCTPEQIKSWEADEWWYCGIAVTASVENVELLDTYSCALWGVEANLEDNKYLKDVANELLPEARKAAIEKLVSLAKHIAVAALKPAA